MGHAAPVWLVQVSPHQVCSGICVWPPSHVPIWRDLLLNHILAVLAAALLQHSLHGTTDNQLPPSAWTS